MTWLIYAFSAAFFLLAYLAKVPASSADPTAEEDLNRPTVSQSLSIPVVFGTRGVSAPNVLDSGNLSTTEIKIKQKGLFGSTKVGTGAFKHYLDELHAIAWGPGVLKEIWSGDFLAWSGSVSTNSSVLISEPLLYGDGDTDGGIEGYIDILIGADAQTPPLYIENRLGRLQAGMPGVGQVIYRGTDNSANGQAGLNASADGFYFGNAPTFKPIKYVWQYLPNPFAHGSNFDLAGDANPVLCLYAMYINDQWGLDLGAQIDIPSFQAAAQTIFDEGLGYSRTWYKGDGKDVEDEILRHCNAVRFRNPSTGAITIKLIRDDYVVGDLLVLNETSIIGFPEMRRNELSTLATELKITYLDRAENDKKRTLTLPHVANRLQLGRRNAVSRDFYGASTATVANKISTREGRQVYYPLLASKIVTDRTAWDYTPGQVFKMSHSEMGLAESIMRVIKVQRGKLLDGKVALEVAEDVFAYGSTVFDSPTSGGTTSLTSAPVDVTSFYLMELPIFLDGGQGYFQVALFAEKPSGDSTDFSVEYNLGDGGVGSFCDIFTFDENALPQATTLKVQGQLIQPTVPSVNIQADGVNLYVVISAAGHEIIAAEQATYSSGTGLTTLTNVKRGLIDTVPKAITAGDKMWVYEPYIFPTAFTTGQTVNVKMLTRTGQGQLASDDATNRSLAITRRAERPLRPGRITLNTFLWPSIISGPVTVDWYKHDNTKIDSLRYWDAGVNEGPEAGTTYTVEFYNHDTSTLLQSTTGITGTTNIWTDSGQSYNLRVEVYASNSPLDSHEKFIFVVPFSQA